MSMDLDPFLVALSTIVDDLSQQHAAPAQPLRSGPRPTVADSADAGAVRPMGGKSERAFLRYVRAHWQSCFPRVLSQSAYNRRGRDLTGVLVALVPLVARVAIKL